MQSSLLQDDYHPSYKRTLSAEFLAQYPDFPEEMNALGRFVYYRTYSRWLPKARRRETWKETCRRAVEYNISLGNASIEEAEEYFDGIFHLRIFLSGRTLWVGGMPVSEKYPMANFNCSFEIIDSLERIKDLFYLLMIGTGVGIRILKRDVAKLPKIRSGIKLVNEPYTPLPKSRRSDDTIVDTVPDSPVAYIVIGDSKEGKQPCSL